MHMEEQESRTAQKPGAIVLSLYPSTVQINERIKEAIGRDCEFLVLSNLTLDDFARASSIFAKFWKRPIYFPIISPGLEAILPLLRMIAFMGGSFEWYLITNDFKVVRSPISKIFADIYRVAAATLRGALSVLFVIKDMRKFRALRQVAPAQLNSLNRVLYIRGNLWFGVSAGGAMSHVTGVVESLLRSGKSVDLVSSANTERIEPNKHFRQIHVPMRTYILPRELSYSSHTRDIIRQMVLRIKNYDVIYERLSIVGMSGVVLAAIGRIPLITEYNGSEVWLARNWGVRLVFEKLVLYAENFILQFADIVVVVSNPLKQELIQRGINSDKIVVQPNGVNTLKFNPELSSQAETNNLRQTLFGDDAGIVFSFVGTFGVWHGADILAEAIVDLKAKKPEVFSENGYRFLFVGEGPNRKAVQSILSNGNVDQFCHFSGLVDPELVPQYLAISDAVIAPNVHNTDQTEFFGSPTKLYEYMASQKIVISSDLGQMKDVLRDCPRISDEDFPQSIERGKIFGVRISPSDVSQLREAISFVGANPNWRKTAGENARDIAIAEHSWDLRVDNIFQSLKSAGTLQGASQNTQKPVRVLINALHSKSGGGLTYLNNILPLLNKDRRIDVHICLHRNQLGIIDLDGLENITPHTMNFNYTLWYMMYFEQVILPKKASSLNYDVLFSPANYGPLLFSRSVLLMRNALSVAFVERRISKQLYWLLLFFGTIFSLARAKAAIAVSEYASISATGGMQGIFARKMRVVSHGVNPVFKPSPFGERKNSEILVVSDIYVQKNLHTLIEALSIIVKNYPKIRLRIAGAPVDPIYFKRIEAQIESAELTNHITFNGNLNQDALLKRYQTCALFVFPSTVETFGNPLVEAMACGAPIACSNTAAMPEVAGEAAEYFDPYDADDMARVISGLLQNDARREELSGIGIERAKMYSWEETARKTADVLIDAARN
jgi:glycosyltransferase involved in cell wall biosynthesis